MITKHLMLVAATLLLPVASAAAQAPATSWPVPPVGETCTSRATARSTGLDYTRTSTFKGNVGGRYCFDVRAPSGTSITCVNTEGNVVESGGQVRIPHSGLFSWPLTVGKEWEYPFTRPDGAAFTKRVKVVSYENVVAGGQTHAAFKLEASGRNMNGGYAWSETAYYAPAIGKTVKYESSDFDKSELLGCAPPQATPR